MVSLGQVVSQLLGRTCELSCWRGGRFIEVVFKTGSTVIAICACTNVLNFKFRGVRMLLLKLVSGHQNLAKKLYSALKT